MAKEFKLNLNLQKIKEVLKADVVQGKKLLSTKINGVYASDLVSDVLAYSKSGSVLLTGLCTKQVVISAYLSLFKAIIFIRGKKPNKEILEFAEEKNIIILLTENDMFEACVKIANADSNSISKFVKLIESAEKKNTIVRKFHIDGQDFSNSGLLSTQIKSILQNIGYDPYLIKRVSISAYESEMNVVMHAKEANLILNANEKEIQIIIDDKGKGIPDIELAMQKGYSTATEDQRVLGFGSGMGLPNIKKNSDELKISSKVGNGTKVEMKFYVTQK